ncbi:oligosaccharide repeat unit polymerase [Stutzerimonas xanthomarina]|uniref:oligosaccharide repeat unit polymerase n=1 Tax=Stutzerimonas xanthomarina TaxID=271420 RepID=UPI003AA90E70
MKAEYIRFISPVVFVGLLWLVYLLSFIPSPIGWHANVNLDLRYFSLVVIYTVSFILGAAICLYKPQKGLGSFDFNDNAISKAPDQRVKKVTKRFYALYFVSSLFVLAKLMKLGGASLFAEDRLLRSLGSGFGGVVDYPANLVTPLGLAAIALYMVTRKKSLLLFAVISFLLQLVQLNRQEAFVCLLGAGIVYFAYSKIKISSLLVIVILALFSLYFVVGGLAIIRYGHQNISQNLTLAELPLWIAHANLTGSMRFTHDVLDMVGAGGFNGLYTLGVFYSIIDPSADMHGAEMVRVMFTSAATAQSVSAPLSYYMDGGYFYLIVVGFLQGFIAKFLWANAYISRSLLWVIIAVLHFFWLLWSLRSGALSINPIFLYQTAAILFVFYGFRAPKKFSMVSVAAISLFLLSLPISLVVMLMRL